MPTDGQLLHDNAVLLATLDCVRETWIKHIKEICANIGLDPATGIIRWIEKFDDLKEFCSCQEVIAERLNRQSTEGA